MSLVHQVIRETATRNADKTAIVCGERRITYETFAQNIRSLSSRLSDAGLSHRDRVVVHLGDKAMLLESIYAVMALGGVAVPLSDGAVFESLREVDEDCRPSILMTDRTAMAAEPRLSSQLGCRVFVVDDPAIQSEAGLANENQKGCDVREDDGALILYTSGTSARKKGVFLTHRNLIQSTLHINEFMQIDSSICEYVGLPFTHSFGFGRSRCVLFEGGTLVFHNGSFNPMAMAQSIDAHQCNALSAVPSGFALCFGRLEPILNRIGSRMRWIELGGAPMPRAHKERLLEHFPHARICMYYGLTEASRSTFIELRTERHKLDSVGQPSPRVDLSIRDEQGCSVPPNKRGEIVIRGDHVAAGYWGDDTINTRNHSRPGEVRTGDYGFLDADGYLHFLGRQDDVINMGGEKISPLEVEHKVREVYPELEICVVGIPDPEGILGDIPVLCYVSTPERTITHKDLLREIGARLEAIQVPKQVFRVERLPKTPNGKTKRSELRTLISARETGFESSD